MKILTALASLILISTVSQQALCAWEGASVTEINKNYADAQFAFDFGVHTGLTSNTQVRSQVNTSVEGFMSEDFTFGIHAQIATLRDGAFYGLGPSGSWYFLRKSNWVAKTTGSIIFRSVQGQVEDTDNRQDALYQQSLALKHHLTPEFAIGPEFALNTILSGDRSRSNNEQAFMMVGLEFFL